MEAIKYYVKGAFQGVAETPQVLEQQEELIADLTAKVADLVAEGKSEEEALGMAIASVGDLSALVSEFGPAENVPVPVPIATVYANRLDLHVVTVSLGIGMAVMIACTGLGAMVHAIEPGAALSLFGALAVGAWWLRMAYKRYRAEPDAVEIRQLEYKARFRQALLVWVGVCFAAFVLNMASGTDFWFWPVWVAATVWPLAVKVEQRLTERDEFTAPEPVATELV